MASHASAVTTMSPEAGPGQLPAGPRLVSAEPPAATQCDRLWPPEVAQCCLCGIALPLGLLVADSGQACADIRWYCKDVMSCTDRWTAADRPERAHIPVPGYAFAVAGTAAADAGTAAADGASAEQPGGMVQEAKSAV